MADTYKHMAAGVVKRTAEQKDLKQKFFKLVGKLLEEAKIQPPPMEVREGLEGALQGIDDLRKGRISGKKIVSRVA